MAMVVEDALPKALAVLRFSASPMNGYRAAASPEIRDGQGSERTRPGRKGMAEGATTGAAARAVAMPTIMLRIATTLTDITLFGGTVIAKL